MLLITHSDSFHLDEVTSTAILLMIYPDSTVLRTRDPEIIKTGDIVYDVGSIYNPETNRYDHHQRGFTETFSPTSIYKLSSAGLIYKHFHEQLFALYNFKKGDDFYEELYNDIYNEYFLGTDANDNGYTNKCDYVIRNLTGLVNSLNNFDGEETKQMVSFMKAVEIITFDLKNYLDKKFNDQRNTWKLTKDAIRDNEEIIISKEWLERNDIVRFEKELNKNIKFFILDKKPEIRVYALNKAINSFELKIPLKDDWRGFSGDHLRNISGIKTITFVHSSGFTGGCKDIDDAILMCKESIKEYLENNKL